MESSLRSGLLLSTETFCSSSISYRNSQKNSSFPSKLTPIHCSIFKLGLDIVSSQFCFNLESVSARILNSAGMCSMTYLNSNSLMAYQRTLSNPWFLKSWSLKIGLNSCIGILWCVNSRNLSSLKRRCRSLSWASTIGDDSFQITLQCFRDLPNIPLRNARGSCLCRETSKSKSFLASVLLWQPSVILSLL
jgi:hypothetical protein